MSLIEVNNVTKVFSRHSGRKLIRQQIVDLFRRRQEEDYFHALTNVSFSVDPGEAVALIGANGAGKSTVLGLVAGLAQPTTGTVKVNGRVSALLELGSGFHPDLTGEENVYVNTALLGFTEKEAKANFASIVDFAGVGEYINEPTRTYSSGMMVRLAFSIAIHVNPGILIVDEVLAVGDASFQEKCLNKIIEMRTRRLTMLWVSHHAELVKSFCDRAIWLHRGEVIMDGPSASVMDAYTAHASDPGAELPTGGVHVLPPPATVGH